VRARVFRERMIVAAPIPTLVSCLARVANDPARWSVADKARRRCMFAATRGEGAEPPTALHRAGSFATRARQDTSLDA